MKYFFALIVATVFAAVKSEDEHVHLPPFQQAEIDCSKEKNVSFEELSKAEAGIFTSDNKLNCFALCLFYKVDFIKPGSDVIDVDVMRKYAKEKGGDKHVDFVNFCADKKGQDLCETTYLIYKCYLEEVNKPGNAPSIVSTGDAAASSPSVVVPAPAAVPAPVLAPVPAP